MIPTRSQKSLRLRHPVTEMIRQTILSEVKAMARLLDMPLSGSPFTEIATEAGASLDQIATYLNYGQIALGETSRSGVTNTNALSNFT